MVGKYKDVAQCGSTKFMDAFVLGGYIGSGIKSKIAYAQSTGKAVSYLKER